MNPWLLAIAAASVSGQPAQIPAAPPHPHMHYEIRIKTLADLSDAEKLERACALAAGISNRLSGAEKSDRALRYYLTELNATACGNPKSK